VAGWRELLLTRVGPPVVLCGVRSGAWWRLLKENGFGVDGPYLLRAVTTSGWALSNSVWGWWEDRAYSRKLAGVRVEKPVFILGHWRSGTTHLHNLLALDDRLAFPNMYQVTYPNTFLCTEAMSVKLGARFVPETRPMDNVPMSFAAASEDEFAVCGMTRRSPYLGMVFPRRALEYDRYLAFRGVEEDAAEWKAALLYFLKKVTWKCGGKPLVLKSPPHTCRIKVLLQMFPDARFVHIHRNPYDVFLSTCHWLRKAAPWWNLQRPEFQRLEERVVRVYREMYELFFEERGLIPDGRYWDVQFEELEREPVEVVRKVYQEVGLGDFEHVEGVVRKYLESTSGYRKNELGDIPTGWRTRIAREWARCFDEWRYDVREN
jgi:hypothetical protein